MDCSFTPLSEVMERAYRPVLVEPDTEYRILGMRSKTGGPFLRERKRGAEVAARTLYRVEAGDFIYSRLFAWQGSFGIVPNKLSGCHVSNEFPTFIVDRARVDPRFLIYWFSLPHTQQLVEKDCYGSTPGTRNRYKDQHLLRLNAPLPTIEKQLRIIAKLDMVSALQDEVASLQLDVRNERTALLVNMAHRHDIVETEKIRLGWTRLALESILKPSADVHLVDPTKYYPNLGIYSFARGAFTKPAIDGSLTSAKVLHRVRKGQFIYSRLFAFEGAYTIVPDELDGSFVSGEFPSFDVDRDAALPQFLAAYFKSPRVWSYFALESVGLGNRRQRVNQDRLLQQLVWLPPLKYQLLIRHVVDRIASNEEGIRKWDLDALMPTVVHRVVGGLRVSEKSITKVGRVSR